MGAYAHPAAWGGEFDAVREKDSKNLDDRVVVTRAAQRAFDLATDVDVLLERARLASVQRFLRRLGHIHLAFVDAQAARFEPGHIQDVAENLVQIGAAFLNVPAIFQIFWRTELAEGLVSIISEKPMMALSGVRSSWLIFARNSDLAM